MKKRLVALVIGLAAIVVAASGPALAKVPDHGRQKRPRTVAQPLATAGIPHGYVVLSSPSLAAPADMQTQGSVSCPPNTVLWGGGVSIASSDLAANVNSSYPSSTTEWAGNVNNASGTDTTFEVWAICAKQPRNGYGIPSATVTNPADSQTVGVARCGGASKILGGGIRSSSSSTAVNINSTYPYKARWEGVENNASGSGATFTVYAICGHAKLRATYSGSAVPNPAGEDTLSGESCPSYQVPAGGGEYSTSTSTSVNLNGSMPSGNGWQSSETNASGSNQSTQSYVICVGYAPPPG